jgi:Tol biopolymer transport system component
MAARRVLFCLLALGLVTPVLASASSASAATPSLAPLDVVAEQAVDGTYVSWRPPADTGGSDVTSYQILRGSSPQDLTPFGTTSDAYVGLGDGLGAGTAAGTTYYYAVRAVTAAGTGASSSAASATTPAVATTPPATRLVTAGVETVSAPHTASGRVLTSGIAATTNLWGLQVTTAIPDDGLYPESVYVYPPSGSRLPVGTFSLGNGYTAGVGTPERLTCTFSSGSVTINALIRSASGAVAIADVDISGTCGGGPAFAQVRIGTDRGFDGTSVNPLDLGPVAVGKTKTGVSTLTNTGTRPVHVSSVDVGGDWTVTTPDTCTGSTVAPGASCSVSLAVTPAGRFARTSVVVFHDDSGAGTQSRDVTAEGTVVPGPPQFVGVARMGGKVVLSWLDAGGSAATSFEILRGTSSADARVIGTVAMTPAAGGNGHYTDPDTTTEGFRWYGIRGKNVAGTGEPTTVTATVGLRPPAVRGAAGASLVGLQWTPSASLPPDPITAWRVYRGTSPSTMAVVADVTTTAWTGPAPAAGAHVYLAVAPLVGTTLGARSAVVDLVGSRVQLITASSLNTVTNPDGSYSGISGSSPLRLHATSGATIGDLKDGGPTEPPYRFEVAVNPRGAQVAYLQSNVGRAYPSELWYRNIDGSGSPVRLLQADYPKAGIAWSLDGSKIVFGMTDSAGGNGFLYTYSMAAHTMSRIVGSDGLASPSYLDSGTLVAQDTASGGLLKLNVTTGARTAIAGTEGAHNPAASADGKQVAYLVPIGTDHLDAVRVMNLTTGAVRDLITDWNGFFTRPSWTRDGTHLFFSDGTGIWDALADGSAPATRFPVVDEGIASLAVSTLDATAPTSVKLAGIPTSTLGRSVTPTFSAVDVGSGVASYTLTYRRATYYGAFGASTSLTLTSPRTIALQGGYTYCFSLKATDKVGNTSAATPEQCTVLPLDDRSLLKSTAFSAITGSAYYASTAMRTTTRGATLTRSSVTSAKQLLLVATTCRTCGTVDVLLGTTRIAAVNLYTATTVNKKVIPLPSFTTRSGTVLIKVTSTGKTVLIDGLGVRR